MEMAWIVTEKILEMLIIVLVGVIAYKKKLIDEAANKRLSDLLLLVVVPLVILMSYQMEFDLELLKGLMWTLAASAATFAVTIGCSELLLRDNPNVSAEKIGVVYSNCGFIGIPLVNGVLGAEGVFYLTAYSTVYNILLWTHGIMLVRNSQISLRETCKNLATPAIFAIVTGLILFLAGIRLPEVIASPLTMIADMNTPLAMIVAGVNLAQGDMIKSMKNLRLYYISFLRLVLFPAVSVVVLMLLPLRFETAFTVLIAAACPAGAMGIMFASRYGGNTAYATDIFTITTLLSVFTIPLMSLAAGLVL